MRSWFESDSPCAVDGTGWHDVGEEHIHHLLPLFENSERRLGRGEDEGLVARPGQDALHEAVQGFLVFDLSCQLLRMPMPL